MAKLIEVATAAMDQYFQDFADRKEFFTIQDFKYHCAIRYSSMLNSLYPLFRKEGKGETGYSNVEINSQWLIPQKIEKESDLKKDETSGEYYVTTSQNIFSFDFDAFGNGLNDIRSYGGNRCDVKKISNQEVKFKDLIPTTPDIYFFLEGKNIVKFLTKPTLPLTLFYIPEVTADNNNCVLSDSVVPEIIASVLKMMVASRNGTVVPEADDGNSNSVMQQQVNPQLTKVQQ